MTQRRSKGTSKGGQFAPSSTAATPTAPIIVESSEGDRDSTGRRQPGLPSAPPDVATQLDRDTARIKRMKPETRKSRRQSVAKLKQLANLRAKERRQERKHLKAVVKANKRISKASTDTDVTALEEARGRLCEQSGRHLWYGGAERHLKTCRVCGVFSDREDASHNEDGHYKRGTSLLEQDGLQYVHDGQGKSYPVAVSHGGYYDSYTSEVSQASARLGYGHPMDMIDKWAESDSEPPWLPAQAD